MAKQSGSYLGGFSGKLGTAVGYMWNGKWCLRAHNPMVRNPRTAAQVEHRELFKQEVQLAAKMRWAVTKTMTELAREAGMTSYNLFVKLNQPAFGAVDGQLAVDYGALRLSVGDVTPVELTEMSRTADNVLTVRYSAGGGNRFDHVYLYAYVPDRGRGYLSAPAYRGDKRVAVALPDYYAGHEAQVYLMVASQDGRWSESLYCGAVSEGEEFLATAPEEGGVLSALAAKDGHSPLPQGDASTGGQDANGPCGAVQEGGGQGPGGLPGVSPDGVDWRVEY